MNRNIIGWIPAVAFLLLLAMLAYFLFYAKAPEQGEALLGQTCGEPFRGREAIIFYTCTETSKTRAQEIAAQVENTSWLEAFGLKPPKTPVAIEIKRKVRDNWQIEHALGYPGAIFIEKSFEKEPIRQDFYLDAAIAQLSLLEADPKIEKSRIMAQAISLQRYETESWRLNVSKKVKGLSEKINRAYLKALG